MKWLLGLIGGPAGWAAAAASAVWDWCVEHWRLVLSVLAVAIVLGWVFLQGAKWKDAQWQKKWAAHEAEDRAVEEEHKKTVVALDWNIDQIENRAAAEKSTRMFEYKKIDDEVKAYVARYSVPALAGACPTDTDIGDDGLRLIERARLSGAHQGH